ncbi:MAG: sulfatase, partial [Planctomycetes bacterium]|nr:sulfatase [Planctomycetota bacterium]
MAGDHAPRKGKLHLWMTAAVVVIAAVAGGAWLIQRTSDPARSVILGEIVSPGSAAGFNVLLITLDTTRPDYLGCYGRRPTRTPTIDSLLDHGVRFDDAVTSVPLTLPAHATLLTGLYPPTSGVRDNGQYQLAPEFVTLAEVLQEQGYDTAAFIASFVLDRRFGLAQGFDLYDFEVDREIAKGPASLEHERRAHDVTTAAIHWLSARPKNGPTPPFFAWVHYFDPHAPYDSPLQVVESADANPYEAEIAFVDLHLKRLLDAVDRLGLRDSTLVALLSDHGEGLGQHQERLHGIFLYESTIRVAFLLSNPVLFDGPSRVDDRVVGLVDLMPTVLDLLGLPQPERMDGLSLLETNVPADRAIYIETIYPTNLGCSALRGLRRHTAKYIAAPRPEYYELDRDPAELRNRHGVGGAALATLQRQLAEIDASWSPSQAEQSAQRALSPEEQRKLAALGYVSLGTSAASAGLPDPKDRIGLVNEMTEVVQLLTEGDLESALALATALAAEAEDWTTPTLMAAEALMRLKRNDERIELLAAFCARHPSAEMLYYLSHALLAAERYEKCHRRLEQAQRLDPNFGAVS